jgi:hypothetical protein
MNDQKDINMNIPINDPDQPVQQIHQSENSREPTPVQPQSAAPQPKAADVSTTKIHTKEQTKLTFLLALTFVLGLISVLSLVFALKMGGNPLNFDFTRPAPADTEEEPAPQQEEEPAPPKDSNKLDLEAEVSKLDEFDLEGIEDDYLDSKLEE